MGTLLLYGNNQFDFLIIFLYREQDYDAGNSHYKAMSFSRIMGISRSADTIQLSQ